MLVSGITAVIHGREEPFGVLCAYSNFNRAFTEDDISFTQAVANVLGGARGGKGIGVSTSFEAEGTKSPLYRIDCGYVGVRERRTR